MARRRRETVAAALLALCCTVWEMPTTVHLDAAAGRVTRATVIGGPGGNGPVRYVGGFEQDDSRVEMTAVAPANGVYQLGIRYRSMHGAKLSVVDVNGLAVSVLLPGTGATFATYAAGRVELRQGENAVTVRKGWGFYDLAGIDLTPAAGERPVAAVGPLCDPAATPAAVALWRTLTAGYGTGTRSGVYAEADDAHVVRATGRRPAIVGGDLMDYSPSRRVHDHDPDHHFRDPVPGLLAHAAAGRIVTLSWHWNAPDGLVDATVTDDHGKPVDARWYKGFNANATTFDVAAAMADPTSPGYALLVRDIDAMAVPLKRFADAGVPVLWRPLHEAENRWFWWGAKGPAAFDALWRLTYDRLTVHHGLHNLIWVYTSDGDPAWYPGNRYCDVVGIDSYPADLRDPLAARWDELSTGFSATKLLAVTEFGGVPDVARMHRLGCRWAYFVSWSGHEGLLKSPDDELRRVYGDPLTLNAEPSPAGTTRPSVTMVYGEGGGG